MANKRISDLTLATTPTLEDLLVVVNEGQTRKMAIEDLLEFLETLEQFATLDETGKIPLEQIPSSILGSLKYKASWDANVNTPAIPAATTENAGWYYVVGTAGATIVDGISSWGVGDWIISNGTSWQKIDNTDAVSSWNGRTGAVVPESGDYDTSQVTEHTSNKYYTAARVLAELLGTITPNNAAIASGDSISTAFNKAQGQINAKESTANKGQASGYAELDGSGKVPTAQLPDAVLGAVTYKGTWAAASALTAASSGNKGWYYVVNANGSYNQDGINDWKVGDWAISNGTVWQKIDNTDAVTSVFGRQGIVTAQSGDYTTTLVTEGTNKYYTAARVLAELLGTVTPSNTAIATGDSISTAFNKTQGQINNRENTANKGQASGYAGLDASGKVPAAQLPTNVASFAGRTGTVLPQSGDYTTSIVGEGTNKYYTAARVLAELLGTVTPSNTAIATGDSISTAFNKAQGQINNRENIANKGAASGYAGLGSDSRVSAANSMIGHNVIATNFTAVVVSTTSETSVYSLQIPAGYFNANDQLNLDVWMGANAAYGNKTIKVYLNTTNSFASGSGAVQVGTYANSANFGSIKFSREISFLTTTTMKSGCNPTISSQNGEYSGFPDNSATTIPNITSSFYVIVTLQKANSSDGLKIDRVVVNGLLAP